MLMYLIAVLVLLAVGFYALSVGVTGHISVGEGPELAAPTRLLVIGIAIIAFGAAYLVYKQPRDGDDGLPPIPATASSPPKSPRTPRGRIPVPKRKPPSPKRKNRPPKPLPINPKRLRSHPRPHPSRPGRLRRRSSLPAPPTASRAPPQSWKRRRASVAGSCPR